MTDVGRTRSAAAVDEAVAAQPTVSVQVLGCSGTYPAPGNPCSGYLLSADGYRLLLDCGNGVLTSLARVGSLHDIDAVVISHLHTDHFADLYGLYYGLWLHPQHPGSVPVHAPRGAQAHIRRLIEDAAFGNFPEVCRFHDVADGHGLELGPFRLRFSATAHPVETLAARVEVDGAVMAYSADSGASPALAAAARDANLFLCEATWLEREGPHPDGLHLTAHEAGRTAAAAGVERLVLTHLLPTTDPAQAVADAAEAFDGEILAARTLGRFDL